MEQSLQGKVVLLTGATEGIGKAAAFSLAKMGARLVLVGRNPEKSAAVLAQIRERTGNAQLELLLADLSRLSEVRHAARAFAQNHDRLDVLLNNAGAYFSDYQTSPDGFELTFALNHLSYFLLTRELLPHLRKTPGARIVNTSSRAHEQGKMRLPFIARRDGKTAGFAAYADSKLANILFSRALAKRPEAAGIAVSCFHPGFVRTGFAQNNEGLMRTLFKFGGKLFGRTPEQGAETLVWLAHSEEGGRAQGDYFFDKQIHKVSALAQNASLADSLYTLSDSLCPQTP